MSETDRYNREWAYLTDTVAVAWPGPPWQGIRRLDELLAAVVEDPDRLLGALLLRAQAGDLLAGRVVVQAMLGKLVRMACRDAEAGLDDYVAHLWLVLMRYPVQRRRGSVAGGLALDTLKAVVADRPRPEPPVAAGTQPDLPDAESVLRRAYGVGLIDAECRSLLTAIYVDGRTSDQAGAQLGLSGAAARQRCRQAVKRLAAARDALAA